MDDFDYKSLTDADLRSMFADFQFRIKPNRQQLISLAFTIDQDLKRVAYWLPVRSGKTIASLLTAEVWGCNKILVVCPTSAFEAWERDIPKASNYDYELITGNRANKVSLMKHGECGIRVINYEGLKSIYAYPPSITDGAWIIDKDSFDYFDCIIFDEVHRCIKYDAIQSDICYELSRRAKHCIGCSADPINKHYFDLFNIYKVIDLGASFGLNFFIYRSAYFYPINKVSKKTGRSWQEWKLRKGIESKILEKIKQRSISFERSECSTVPENEPIAIDIEPSDEFLKMQKLIVNQKFIEIGGKTIDCSKPSTKGHKLLQLSGGFIYYDDSGEQLAYRLNDNPKLKSLIDLINKCDGKVIIIHRYVDEGLIIEDALSANSISYISMHGGMKESKHSITSKFTNDLTIKALVVQQACSEGWDGKAAKYLIFYSQVASPRLRNQLEGRIKGDGQSPDYKIYDLLVKKSLDVVVKNSLKRNVSFSKTVMGYIRSFSKGL